MLTRRDFLRALLHGATLTAAGVYVPRVIYSFPSARPPLDWTSAQDERPREHADVFARLNDWIKNGPPIDPVAYTAAVQGLVDAWYPPVTLEPIRCRVLPC